MTVVRTPNQSTSVSLRPVGPADEAFLLAVYAGTRTEEMAAWGWDEVQREAFLNMQFAAQQRFYSLQYPEADHHIILLRGQAIGRIIVIRTNQEIRLADIALLPEWRGAGIGASLIKDLLEEATEVGVPVRLQVLPEDGELLIALLIAPSGPQNYGAIAPGGSATRPFTLTADGAPGSMIPVTLQLQDGATNLGTATFNITLGMNMSCRIPRLVVSSTLTRDDAMTVRATYTVQNVGAVTAINVTLTTAMLGSTNTTTALPQALGNLLPGQTSMPMAVFFANSQPAGTSSTLKLNGNYTGGTFNSTKRATIP